MKVNDAKKLKVLMTTDTVGGVWTYCVELCRSLPAVTFFLFTSGSKLRDDQREEIKDLDNVKVYETNFKLEWMESPWEDIDESSKMLLNIEQEVNPDIVHLNSFSYGSLPFKAKKIVVAHSDVFTWWKAVKNEMPPDAYKEYFKRVNDGLHNADLVVAPSNSMMDSLKQIYGFTTRSQVIYNGRSGSLFKKRDKEPYIFAMGRVWDEAKNISLLVEASGKLKNSIKIAGDNKFLKNEVVIENKNVQFLGRLTSEQAAEFLSKAAVFVAPGKYEPFGLSILEAAMCGCALVLGNIPSLREIWGDSALYVETNNPVQLAETVNELFHDKEKLKLFSEKAEQKSSAYSARKMAEQYVYTYTTLQHQRTSKTSAAVI